MHKIYEAKGSFNLEYELPKIVYSSLISIILNTLLNFFSLSKKEISEFKQNKTSNNTSNLKTQLETKLKIKFSLYFLISFIFLLYQCLESFIKILKFIY